MLRHRKALLLFLIRRGASEADAEDIVQDVFVRVREAAHTFRGAAQVSSWLHSISRNLLVDRMHAQRREQTLDERQWDAMGDTFAALRDATYARYGSTLPLASGVRNSGMSA